MESAMENKNLFLSFCITVVKGMNCHLGGTSLGWYRTLPQTFIFKDYKPIDLLLAYNKVMHAKWFNTGGHINAKNY